MCTDQNSVVVECSMTTGIRRDVRGAWANRHRCSRTPCCAVRCSVCSIACAPSNERLWWAISSNGASPRSRKSEGGRSARRTTRSIDPSLGSARNFEHAASKLRQTSVELGPGGDGAGLSRSTRATAPFGLSAAVLSSVSAASSYVCKYLKTLDFVWRLAFLHLNSLSIA